jgi:hypothetical protein
MLRDKSPGPLFAHGNPTVVVGRMKREHDIHVMQPLFSTVIVSIHSRRKGRRFCLIGIPSPLSHERFGVAILENNTHANFPARPNILIDSEFRRG